jgi:hypothetical protein
MLIVGAIARIYMKEFSHSGRMHRCEAFNLLLSSAFLFNNDALFCRGLQKSKRVPM